MVPNEGPTLLSVFGSPIEPKASAAHAGRDTASHFDGTSMELHPSADGGNSFDRVYGTQHEDKDTEDHFMGSTMLVGSNGEIKDLAPSELDLWRQQLEQSRNMPVAGARHTESHMVRPTQAANDHVAVDRWLGGVRPHAHTSPTHRQR